MKNKCTGLFLLSGLVLVLTGCGGGSGSGEQHRAVTVKGSDTMVILAQSWAENYMKEHPGLTIQVTGGGSGVGIAALINGGTDICEASRPMKEVEKDQVTQTAGKGRQRNTRGLGRSGHLCQRIQSYPILHRAANERHLHRQDHELARSRGKG